MKTFALALVSAASLTACVNIQADSHAFDHDSSDMTVKAVQVVNDQVMITVSSDGCTDKSFLSFEVDKIGQNSFEVEFEREKEDYCRALMPDGVELVYSFVELGLPSGALVEIDNRVSNK